MKISQDVREFAASEKAKEAGLKEMAEKFKESGGELYQKVAV